MFGDKVIKAKIYKTAKTCTKLHPLRPTASLHVKIGGWKTILSFWVSAYFQVLFYFLGCTPIETNYSYNLHGNDEREIHSC